MDESAPAATVLKHAFGDVDGALGVIALDVDGELASVSSTFFSPYCTAMVPFLTSASVTVNVSEWEDLAEWTVSPFMSLMSSRSVSVEKVKPSSEMKPSTLKAASSDVVRSVGLVDPSGAR